MQPAFCTPRTKLALEVVRAVVAVVSLSSAGEPTLALPNVALALRLLDHSHPPVDQEEDCDADAPLDDHPDQEQPTEHQEPKAALLAFDVGQLNALAAALRALLIHCHVNYLSLSVCTEYILIHDMTDFGKSQRKKWHYSFVWIYFRYLDK